MNFNKIDFDNWDRKEIYLEMSPCNYYITVDLDISKFFREIKHSNKKFYPSICHLLTTVVNQHSEFRFAKCDGEIGYFDQVNPIYTLLRPGNLYTHMVTDYSDNFEEFYRRFIVDTEVAKRCKALYCRPRDKASFSISITPDIAFGSLSFSYNLESKHNYIPFVTVGKYFERDGKLLMPLAVEFHHEVNDGYHAGKFFEYVQTALDSFII